MMRNILFIFLCFISLNAKAVGPQSPPLTTDDPGTPGPQVWEVNFVFSGEFTPEAREYELPLLDINYGIGESFQLKYEVPWGLEDEGEVKSNYAIGNSKVGVKYNFFDDEEYDLSLALYPQYEFISGSGISTLPLLISKSSGDFTVGFNLGYNKITNSNSDSVYSSVAVSNALSETFTLMGEVRGDKELSSDIRSALFNVGAVLELSPHRSFFWSMGHTLGPDAAGRQVLFALIGFSFTSEGEHRVGN